MIEFSTKQQNGKKMDIATSISTASAAYTLLKGLINETKDFAEKEKLIELQGNILDLQGCLREADTVIHDLKTHRDKLQKELDNSNDFETRKAQYSAVQLSYGSSKYSVYLHNATPDLYACPNCMEIKELILPLQNNGSFLGCNHCKLELQIGSNVTINTYPSHF